VVLEENYALDTLMPEYLHALAGRQPVEDFEYHGVLPPDSAELPARDAAISMWWWNSAMHWTPTSRSTSDHEFPAELHDPAKRSGQAMRDALDVRRLGREIAAFGRRASDCAALFEVVHAATTAEGIAEIGTFPYLSRCGASTMPRRLRIVRRTDDGKKILSGDLAQRRSGAARRGIRSGTSADAILDWVTAEER